MKNAALNLLLIGLSLSLIAQQFFFCLSLGSTVRSNNETTVTTGGFDGRLTKEVYESWFNFTVSGALVSSTFTFNMANKGIVSLDDNVFESTYMDSVNFSSNRIENLTRNNLNGLSSTMILDFSSNRIKRLDKPALDDLLLATLVSFRSNQISHIGDNCFARLTQLQYLDLSDNQLGINNSSSSLSAKSFNGLYSLRVLNLTLNRLGNMQNSFQIFNRLTSLNELYLASNGLTYIDRRSFSELIYLKKLDLSNNQLINVRTSVFNGLCLDFISFDNNPVKEKLKITLVKYQCAKIEFKSAVLDNYDGQLSKLVLNEWLFRKSPASKKNLTTFLELNNRNITNILTGTFYDFSNLIYLHLENNSIASLTGMEFMPLIDLHELYLNHNRISYVGRYNFDDLKQLKLLSLSYNQIEDLDPNSFEKNTNLVWLYLNRNKIQSIPQGLFTNLKKLNTLDLSNNRIRLLNERTFVGPINLWFLFLNDNLISSVANGTFINSLSSLKRIDLSNNQITKMNVEPFNVMCLEQFKLDGNEIKYEYELRYYDTARECIQIRPTATYSWSRSSTSWSWTTTTTSNRIFDFTTASYSYYWWTSTTTTITTTKRPLINSSWLIIIGVTAFTSISLLVIITAGCIINKKRNNNNNASTNVARFQSLN